MEKKEIINSNTVLVKRALILFLNGFGFDYQPNDNMFILAYVETSIKDKLPTIKELSGSSTVNEIQILPGKYFIRIHFQEYDKHIQVLNSLLTMGTSFTTKTKLSVNFNFEYDKEYSKNIVEYKAIDMIKNIMMNSSYTDFIPEYLVTPNVYDIWNWETMEGQEFCRILCKNYKRGNLDFNNKNNYFNWGEFKDYDPKTLKSNIIENKQKKEEQIDEDFECMICLTNKPDTMVLPCEHVIVCKQCSAQLKNTNDAKKCVRCRRLITHILE